MSRAGELASAEAFFGWCSDVVRARAGRIRRGEHLHARYTLAGEESEAAWPTYQLDGHGTWLWSLCAHAKRHSRSVARFREAGDLCASYVAARWREPCTDWWEERVGVHPATLACLHAGLAAWEREEAAPVRAELARAAAVRLDASLLVLETPFATGATVPLDEIERELVSPGGGVHRHRADTYHGGGEWLLLTAWLGWHYATLGRRDEAAAKLEWVAAHARADGHLPEQVAGHLLAPELLEPWERRWGLSACPLLWSHAMYLTLALELGIGATR